jgi:hypothetical protein
MPLNRVMRQDDKETSSADESAGGQNSFKLFYRPRATTRYTVLCQSPSSRVACRPVAWLLRGVTTAMQHWLAL